MGQALEWIAQKEAGITAEGFVSGPRQSNDAANPTANAILSVPSSAAAFAFAAFRNRSECVCAAVFSKEAMQGGDVYREAVSLPLDVIERRRAVAAGVHGEERCLSLTFRGQSAKGWCIYLWCCCSPWVPGAAGPSGGACHPVLDGVGDHSRGGCSGRFCHDQLHGRALLLLLLFGIEQNAADVVIDAIVAGSIQAAWSAHGMKS